MILNGVLVIDKPAGPTSHDVVARVRRALREKRIGHTGTLDPLATGVLALLIGRATRLSRFLVTDEKEYLADVRLGVSTPTYDAEGLEALRPGGAEGDMAAANPVAVDPPGPGTIDDVLSRFRGTFLQTPPPYSAKKIQGTRSYELARRDAAVALRPVEVTVRALERLPSDDPMRLRLRVVCTSGFYVRTLAHEVGRGLGRGGHLEGLRRTRSGAFTIEQAVPLEAVERDADRAVASMIPMDQLLEHLPRIVLDEEDSRRVGHGSAIRVPTVSNASAGNPAHVRLVDAAGRLLAIAEPRPGGVLHPAVVLV